MLFRSEPVIVMDDAAVNVQSFHLHKLTLYHPYRMKSAFKEENVPYDKVLALVEQEVIRPMGAGDACRWQHPFGRAPELSPLPVDGALPFDYDVFSADGV